MESVKIFCKSGKGKYMVSESTIEIFLSRMKVSRVEERCFIDFATPDGGLEIEMPRAGAIDMIESLLLMLPVDDVQELLAGIAEKM